MSALSGCGRECGVDHVKARTTSGSRRVTTPPAQYQISANSYNGDKDVTFENDPSGKYRRSVDKQR
ncbi:hypothetical protein AB0A91_10800 [Streptomyces sp. NPDC042207]|uniref:hypothetical protein n=1 Tax=Streptomyces sp. NPDC042207 TaxID=3154331 RepID=UPI0033F179C2